MGRCSGFRAAPLRPDVQSGNRRWRLHRSLFPARGWLADPESDGPRPACTRDSNQSVVNSGWFSLFVSSVLALCMARGLPLIGHRRGVRVRARPRNGSRPGAHLRLALPKVVTLAACQFDVSLTREPRMQCCYINLDRALQRKEDIEASFKAAARPGWRLGRFRALDAAFVEEQLVEGSRTKSEKACFMSHRAVIQKYAGSAEHLLVVEDDVVFGVATFDIVDGFLQQNAEEDWDLLFLDISAIDIRDMLTMYFNREKFIRQRKVIPLDLARLPFFGDECLHRQPHILRQGTRLSRRRPADRYRIRHVPVEADQERRTEGRRAVSLSSPRFPGMRPCPKSSGQAPIPSILQGTSFAT